MSDGIFRYNYDAVYTGEEFINENVDLGVKLGMYPKMSVPAVLSPLVDSKFV